MKGPHALAQLALGQLKFESFRRPRIGGRVVVRHTPQAQRVPGHAQPIEAVQRIGHHLGDLGGAALLVQLEGKLMCFSQLMVDVGQLRGERGSRGL